MSRKCYLIISSLLIVFLLLQTAVGVGIEPERHGSIAVEYLRNIVFTPIPHAEFTLYRVGDLKGNGKLEFVPTSEFTASGIDINNFSSISAQLETAEKLKAYIDQGGVISGTTHTTNYQGRVSYYPLPTGLYLLVQTNTLSNYTTMSPQLVSIPIRSATGLIYDVSLRPKTQYNEPGSGGDGEEITVTVSKIWDDADDSDAIRPGSVKVTLLRNGAAYKTASLTRSNNWSKISFSNLPTGPEYTIKEDSVPGYEATISGNAEDGFVIVNKHEPTGTPIWGDYYTSVSVKKLWDDENDASGLRPTSVTVQLIRNDTVYKTAELREENNWYYKFNKLPIDKYTVSEISVPDYAVSYTRLNGGVYFVTNEQGGDEPEEPLPPMNPELTSITVTKVWQGDGESRPSVTVSLMKDGEPYRACTLNGDNDWQHTFEEVPRDGNYTIHETPVENYKTAYSGDASSGYVIINTYEEGADEGDDTPPETDTNGGSLKVKKRWRDDDDEAGIRPNTVTVQLIRNSSIYRSLILNEENGWVGEFRELPLGDEYTVWEVAPANYSAEYSGSVTEGYTITNRLTPGTTDPGEPPDSDIIDEPSDDDPDDEDNPNAVLDAYRPKPGDEEPTLVLPSHRPKPGEQEGAISAIQRPIPDVKIPQTGLLYWPVPVLAAAGILLILLGIADKRRRRSGKR